LPVAKVNKKTLAAQAEQSRETATYQHRATTLRDQSYETQRGMTAGGLGSAEQLSGAYAGAQQRDLSRYSQGLMVTGDQQGGYQSVMASLQRGGLAGDQWVRRSSSGHIRPYAGAEVDENGIPLDAYKLDKKTGQQVLKGNWATIQQLADEGDKDAINALRQHELAGQIQEVDNLFKQAYDLAASGDYEQADALRSQAEGLVDQYGLNENFDPSGMNKDLAGLKFSIGDRYDPLTDPEGGAQAALGSPTGMLVGEVLNQARQMMDPTSAESMRFKDALTSGAVAAVDQSRDNALRAMASQERGAARSMRDMALSSGQASQTGKMAAIAARSSERFAEARTTLEGNVAAQKAQIYGDAAKLYETVRLDLANNAVGLASAWVNDQAGVRDAFRQLHASIMMNYTSNLFGFAQSTQGNAVQMQMQANALKAGEEESGGWQGGLTGAVTGASAGASLGPWGALAGGVLGGVLGAI
jgi:hypothetical protein